MWCAKLSELPQVHLSRNQAKTAVSKKFLLLADLCLDRSDILVHSYYLGMGKADAGLGAGG